MHILNRKKYIIMRKAIDANLAEFIFNYLILKKHVYKKLLNDNYFNNNIEVPEWGTFKDHQSMGSFSSYGDMVMETLLMLIKPKMEKILNTELIPSYSYTRLYEKGAELKIHTDRISCEISTTLNLGGDNWPIFFKIKKEIKVELKPGDMVLYLGEQIPHWRKIFKGNICGQVFLHYNTKQRNNLAADGRPFVGLPHPYRKDTDETR